MTPPSDLGVTPPPDAAIDQRSALPRRLLVLCLLVAFVALAGAGVAVLRAVERNQSYTGWVNHTFEVGLAVEQATAIVERTETARRGYLLTADARYAENYRAAAAELAPAIDAVARLVADNPRQRARLVTTRRVLAELVATRARTVALTEAGDVAAARAIFVAESGASRMRRLRALLSAMGDDERRLLAQRTADQRASQRAFYGLLALAAAILAAVVAITALVVVRYTRDLNRAAAELRGFNTALESRVAERTADLSRANEELQRFAYIVSHDLRSPLVNVMGFTAELEAATGALAALVDRTERDAPALVDDAARLAAREDLPEAITFIRTSTQKMDRLINAILSLSRQGRRVLAPEPIDLAELAGSVVTAMAQPLADRGARVTVETPLPPLVSDRLALDQILSNLIENASKYAAPGRPPRIAVRARRDGDRVSIEVEDNGRGIDPRDHQRVFDLFRRSGAQDVAGEGIGLANVRALAYRLGGTIDVRSTPGEGSTFALTLPSRLNDMDSRA